MTFDDGSCNRFHTFSTRSAVSISQLMAEVLGLQASYSPSNTSEMSRRGLIVRQELPEEIREVLLSDRRLSEIEIDLRVNGGDGIGRKSRIPYTRVFSPTLSSAPTEGWYVVFLFSSEGQRCYLTLGHSSTLNSRTPFGHPNFVPLSDEDAKQLMEWGRRRVPKSWTSSPRVLTSIDLGAGGQLGLAYERTTLIGFEYVASSMPTDDEVIADLKDLLPMLKTIYESETLESFGAAEDYPEVVSAISAVEEVEEGRTWTSRRSRGQGRGNLTKQERIAIERRAVDVVTKHYLSQGWQVEDTGATESYDLVATRVGEQLIIEVKGTTSTGEYVILTRNEVRVNRAMHPNNALAIVSEIELTRGEEPFAAGGRLNITSPWEINDGSLEPIQFVYSTPPSPKLRQFSGHRNDLQETSELGRKEEHRSLVEMSAERGTDPVSE